MSAWLWAPAGAALEVALDDGADDDVAWLVAELLHAPMAATAASAATPVTTVLVLLTTHIPSSGSHFGPFSRRRSVCSSRSVKIR